MATAATTSKVSQFRISVVAMTGAAISIDDASAADTILSVKERVFAANDKMPVRRQRLVFCPGPRGMDALADDETLGGAGVAQDGSAELDVLIEPLTEAEMETLGVELIAAATNGIAADVDRLIKDGANVEAKDAERERTALIWAGYNGHADCVRLLLHAGADEDAKGNKQESALLLAAFKGHADCARLLLDAGSNKEAKNVAGNTSLMLAAFGGSVDCVRLLLDAGVDTEATSSTGSTALIWAATFGQPDCARLLLDAGADKNTKDNDGKTALDHATQEGIHDVARIIESHVFAETSK